jgi:hypothetical protein
MFALSVGLLAHLSACIFHYMALLTYLLEGSWAGTWIEAQVSHQASSRGAEEHLPTGSDLDWVHSQRIGGHHSLTTGTEYGDAGLCGSFAWNNPFAMLPSVALCNPST